MNLPDLFLGQPLATQISLVALFVSLLGFLHTIRTSSSKSALDRATKKTEIYLKLVETTIMYRNMLSSLIIMQPSMEDCRADVDGLVDNIERSILECESTKDTIKKLPFLISAVQLEAISRDVHELYLKEEALVPRVMNMSKECRHYHKLSREYVERLPFDQRPERITCTLYKREKQPNKL